MNRHQYNHEYYLRNKQRSQIYAKARREIPEVREANLERSRKWHSKHRDEIKKYNKKYNKKHKTEIKLQHHDYYLRNKKTILATRIRLRAELTSWLREYKKKLTCEICGENHPQCLDFHHRKKAKGNVAVSKLMGKMLKKERILLEIKKCKVLCSNCHRKLHYKKGRVEC